MTGSKPEKRVFLDGAARTSRPVQGNGKPYNTVLEAHKMKTYKFAVVNWKNDMNRPFWIYKQFPSAYYADQWAMRITFKKRNSMYNVIFQAGEEF